MVLRIPKISTILPTGIWADRKNVRGIFLKEHDLKKNAEVLEVEVRDSLSKVSPHNLLFLVEGINYSSSREVLAAQRLVNEHQIKTEDPIVNPFSSEIARETSVELVHVALSRLVLDYLVSDSEGLVQLERELKPDELISFGVDATAREFGVSPKNLRRQFSHLSFHDQPKLQQEIDLLAKIRQRLIDKSNVYSRENLEGILDENKQPNVLAMVGGAHEGVFESTFVQRNMQINLNSQYQTKPYYVTDRALNPEEQLLAIRRNTSSLVPEKLAAGWSNPAYHELDRENSVVKQALLYTPLRWEDFEKILILEDKYINRGYRTDGLYKIVVGATPRLLSNGQLYSESLLTYWAQCDLNKISKWNEFWYGWRTSCKRGAINSAKALRTIVEKIGNDLPDEAEIIRKLLTAALPEVRDIGAEAAYATKKHRWRNDSGAVWGLINVLDVQAPARRRKIEQVIVSADPRFLFAKDKDDKFIIYRGKDPEVEKVLVECGQEDDGEIRAKAFSAIGNYLVYHDISASSLDEVLINGAEKKDENALFAIANRHVYRNIRNPRLIPLLVDGVDAPVWQNRSCAFLAIGRYLEREIIDEPQLKPLSRKHFDDENEQVRIGATNIFGVLISRESVLEVQDSDIQSLLHIASSDSNKLARSNATYALSVIIDKDMDLIPEEKLDQVEHLCAVNRDPEIATKEELQTINEALNRLVTVSGLEEVKLLLELEGHPSREKVEKLIRKKDRYRDAIGPLLERIGALYQANLKLGANLEALTAENLALKEEGIELKQKIQELAQELTRINNSIKSKRVKTLLLSVGGTAFRNVVKGRGVGHGEFVKSIFIDAGWDQIIRLII